MITEVKLTNFKSFKNETIELGPFSLVLGGNGAGKSNFFDAMRFLRSIGEGRPVRDAIEGHAPPGSLSPTVSGIRGGGAAATHFLSDSTTLALQVVMEVAGRRITYFVEIDARRHRVVNEELRSSGHPGVYVYSTKPETGTLEQRVDSPVLAARFHKSSRGLNPKREFSPTEFILTQFTSRRAESKVNEDEADLVRWELASISPLEVHPEILRKYSPMGSFEMGEHGENFAAAVWRLNFEAEDADHYKDVEESSEASLFGEAAIARRSAVLAWLNQVTPRPITSLQVEFSPTNEVIVSVNEEPYSKPITAPSLSDGTLRFAALALASVGQQGRRTLLIEELENGINPSRIALLISMFEQVVEADKDIQVIASTHSPSILNYATTATSNRAVVIGWDEEENTSRAVLLKNLPGLSQSLETQSLGDLQEEGWIQLAAGL